MARLASFYPGAVETYGYDIDNQGTIIGYFLDRSGGYGGFRAAISTEKLESGCGVGDTGR